MDEFVSRMATQRQVLDIVNRSNAVSVEKLFGLSSDAIERWRQSNGVDSKSEIALLLERIASELFFMATRSQEPVSAEYEVRRKKIIESVTALEKVVDALSSR